METLPVPVIAGGVTVPAPEATGPRIDTAPVPVIAGGAATVPVPAAVGPAMVTAAVPDIAPGPPETVAIRGTRTRSMSVPDHWRAVAEWVRGGRRVNKPTVLPI